MKSWNTPWNSTATVPVERNLERGTAETQCRRGFQLERHVERNPISHSGTFHPSLRDGTVERAERNDETEATAELLDWAMRTCDRHGDGPEAREAMRRDCLATPVHLRADLLAHFKQTNGGMA